MEQSVASSKPRHGFKEFVRKFFVSLKRNPQNIALIMMLVTYVFYSLNLTSFSDATAFINRANMGQCQFVSMLLGILAFVSFLRAFPRREKPSLLMIGLTVLMLAATTAAEFLYVYRINYAVNLDPVHPISTTDAKGELTEAGKAILTAQSVGTIHIILLIICIGLIVLLPVYGKLIKKINTSIEVAGNEDMSAIDMASED